MVVRDHVRVPVLRLVRLEVRVVPAELLAGLDRLVLRLEDLQAVRLQLVHVLGEVRHGDRRVVHHRCGTAAGKHYR